MISYAIRSIRFAIGAFDQLVCYLGNIYIARLSAGGAQQVEQLICNRPVGGSIPSASSTVIRHAHRLRRRSGGGAVAYGEIPKRPKGADCKSVGSCLRRFESSSPHQVRPNRVSGVDWGHTHEAGGNSSVARARAFQARGRGVESRFPLPVMSRVLRGLSAKKSFYFPISFLI